MRDEDFESWFERLYGRKPQPSAKQGDLPHTTVYMTMFADGAFRGWAAHKELTKALEEEVVKLRAENVKLNGGYYEPEPSKSKIEKLQAGIGACMALINKLRERFSSLKTYSDGVLADKNKVEATLLGICREAQNLSSAVNRIPHERSCDTRLGGGCSCGVESLQQLIYSMSVFSINSERNSDG